MSLDKPSAPIPSSEDPEMETCKFCGFDFPEGDCCDAPPAAYCIQALEKDAKEKLALKLAALTSSLAKAPQNKMVLVAGEPTQPYVRIRKLWQRNSGFAQYTWLYYVDLVRHDGETARSVGVTCHAGEMNEYGMTKYQAEAKAKEIAGFFDWIIREFEEERTTTTVLKEK